MAGRAKKEAAPDTKAAITKGQATGKAPVPKDDLKKCKELYEVVQGIQFSTDEHGNVQAAYIRGKNGGMKLVSGLENVSSKIWEEKVWKH